MSALLLEIQPIMPAPVRLGHAAPAPMLAALATVAGALAPWLLLVTAYAGLTRTAAACLVGPMPI
ncbi:MAG: hypothetical protein ACJ8H8_00925 [Geminicoccaceae bacterium]